MQYSAAVCTVRFVRSTSEGSRSITRRKIAVNLFGEGNRLRVTRGCRAGVFAQRTYSS